MILIFLFVLLIFIILIIFSFPKFSPIPYFPSNKKDLNLIIKSLNLHNNQNIIDLGAGDGIIIFYAAEAAFKRKLNTKFIAVDINPILLLVMNVKRLFHPNKRNIKIIYGNIFTMNFNYLTQKLPNSQTFYLYISPWHIEKTINNIKKQLKHFAAVSYMYRIPSLSKKEKIICGKIHDIYTYIV